MKFYMYQLFITQLRLSSNKCSSCNNILLSNKIILSKNGAHPIMVCNLTKSHDPMKTHHSTSSNQAMKTHHSKKSNHPMKTQYPIKTHAQISIYHVSIKAFTLFVFDIFSFCFLIAN